MEGTKLKLVTNRRERDFRIFCFEESWPDWGLS